MTAIKELSVDILVIGSGAAGLAAAAAAARLGQNVLVADEKKKHQTIHLLKRLLNTFYSKMVIQC